MSLWSYVPLLYLPPQTPYPSPPLTILRASLRDPLTNIPLLLQVLPKSQTPDPYPSRPRPHGKRGNDAILHAGDRERAGLASYKGG